MDTPGGMTGRALARWRRGRAVELALAGHDYDAIASQLGYSSRASAWKTVQEALRERTVANVDQYRAVTLERLERLIQAHWPRATSGEDARSANVVLKVLAAQSKLLGLEAKPSDVMEQPRTVVIGGTSEQYIAGLKAVSDRTDW